MKDEEYEEYEEDDEDIKEELLRDIKKELASIKKSTSETKNYTKKLYLLFLGELIAGIIIAWIWLAQNVR